MARFDRVIPPGGEGKIILEVNTTGYSGNISKSAAVKTNDPLNETFKLLVRAEVRPHIVVTPTARFSLTGIVGDTPRGVVRIEPGDDHPLEIEGVKTNLEGLIDYNLRREKGHTYYLEVTLKGTEAGSRHGYVRLATNHPKKKEVRLPVYIHLRPELEIRPQQVSFGKIRRQAAVNSKGPKKAVIVRNNRNAAFSLGEVQTVSDYFEVKVTPAGQASASTYRIEIIPRFERLPAGATTDTLVIGTNWPNAREFKVPMAILVED